MMRLYTKYEVHQSFTFLINNVVIHIHAITIATFLFAFGEEKVDGKKEGIRKVEKSQVG